MVDSIFYKLILRISSSVMDFLYFVNNFPGNLYFILSLPIFCEFQILFKLIRELNRIFHAYNAFLRSSMLEYLGEDESFIIFLPSSIAAAVISFGTSNFNSKEMPCSRMAVLKKRLMAVVIFKPSSSNIFSDFSFIFLSILLSFYSSGLPISSARHGNNCSLFRI